MFLRQFVLLVLLFSLYGISSFNGASTLVGYYPSSYDYHIVPYWLIPLLEACIMGVENYKLLPANIISTWT